MAFNSITGKLAGQKSTRKGIRNNSSKRVKNLIEEIMLENLEVFKNDFQQIDSKERLRLLVQMIGFFIPKLRESNNQQVNIEANNSEYLEKILELPKGYFENE